MRLEQVLARWAGEASIAGSAQTAAAASVAGRWTNEYGSVAEIGVEGERLVGTYTSKVGSGSGTLSGPLTGFVRRNCK